MRKGSFFEKLTGGYYGDEEEEVDLHVREGNSLEATEEEDFDGQLTTDVYQTADEIVIESMVAAVKPEDLDIDITREMVTIRGHRHNNQHVEEEDYFYRELYWGSFTRTIVLPQEIDVDASEATQRNGLLTITLPKINKNRMHKLRVKMN